MDRKQREELRQKNREKNERRRAQKAKNTLHAQAAAKARKEISTNGAFGKVDPETFNKLAEGTSAPRRAEIDWTTHLEEQSDGQTGEAKKRRKNGKHKSHASQDLEERD